MFSHKEVTVLFVPDLSECLPSLDAWRDQWLAHQKVVAERDHLLSLRREVFDKAIPLCSLYPQNDYQVKFKFMYSNCEEAFILY